LRDGVALNDAAALRKKQQQEGAEEEAFQASSSSLEENAFMVAPGCCDNLGQAFFDASYVNGNSLQMLMKDMEDTILKGYQAQSSDQANTPVADQVYPLPMESISSNTFIVHPPDL
jgi:hypothetical protein